MEARRNSPSAQGLGGEKKKVCRLTVTVLWILTLCYLCSVSYEGVLALHSKHIKHLSLQNEQKLEVVC